MSWHPTFWIRHKDYEKLADNLHGWDVWDFSIGGLHGEVIGGGETSSANRQLHEIIQSVPHWILNSECGSCEQCHEWGERVEYLIR